MKDNKWTSLLRAIEAQNTAELGDNTSHRFPRQFEKHARAVCRGEATPASRRRLPLWACAILVVLLAAVVTGCAVAVYHLFPRAVPYYGIVDFDSDIAMFSTTETVRLEDAEIETLLYIRDGENGRLLLWGQSDDPIDWKEPACSVTIDGTTYELRLSSGGSLDGPCSFMAECSDVLSHDTTEPVLHWKNQSQPIRLADISDDGYSVSEWANIEGYTVKILPLYTNNRLFIVECDDIENAAVSVSIKAYDTAGNMTQSHGAIPLDDRYYLIECDKALSCDLERIEIESFKIDWTIPKETYTVPLTDGVPLDIPLLDAPLFTDRVTGVEHKDGYWYVYTECTLKNPAFTDIMIPYYFYGAKQIDSSVRYGENSIQYFTYRLEETDAEALTVTLDFYMCVTHAGSGEPLAVIELKKER